MEKTDVNLDPSVRKVRDAEENQLDSAHIRGIFKNWIFELFSQDETSPPPPETILEVVKRAWMELVRLMKPQKDAVTPTRLPGKRRRILLLPLIILIPYLSYFWASGLLSEFLSSPLLALAGPIWITITLWAFYWFSVNLPEMLEEICQALERQDQCEEILKKWGKWSGNWQFIVPLAIFSIFISIFNYLSLKYAWDTGGGIWEVWTSSPKSVVFYGYLVINLVVVLPSLLSTGLVMLFGSILIIRELLKSIPLKLDLYRRLRSVGDLSLGVAFWTFLAMVNIVGAGIFSGFYLPLVGLTVLASAGLFAILFFPVMSARNAIIRAKRRKLTTYERRLHTLFSVVDYRISAKAERNEKTLAAHMAAVGEDYPDLKELLTVDAPLDKLFAAREETQQFIKEIEDIPALPITWVGLLQIVITSSSPTAGLLIAQWLTGKQQ